MKTPHWTCTLFVTACIYLTGSAQESSPSDPGYTPQTLGPNQTRWWKITAQTNDQAQTTFFTNSFIQIGSGLNRWQSNRWMRATPELIATNGGVLARGGQATAFFSSNLNSQGATRIRMPDGQWLKTHLLGLAYYDTASGTNLLLAAPKDCAPQIIATNRVAYVDALDDLRCDVVFSFTPAGVRQDLIFRERPDSPRSYGLSNASTHLLLISEIDEGPTPVITERTLPAGTETLRDQTLDFGTMQMVPGRAFRLERANRRHDIFVSKEYETIGTRHFIVERIRYARVHPELLSLPLTGGLVTNNPSSTFTNGGVRRTARWYARDNPPLINRSQAAFLPGSAKTLAFFQETKGFVWDWDLVTSASDVTFACGTTYQISGEVHLLGNTVLTPGAILKFDDDASLYVDGWLTCPDWDDTCWDTTVLLTSVFDNTGDAGEAIRTDHGPVGGSYGPALCLNPSFLDSALNHCSVRYADPGIISNNRSLVTVAATDPSATKSSLGDTASFTITRVDGDWTGELYVSFNLTGTARLGIDYALAFYPNLVGDQPGTVVIPPGTDSAVVCIVPSGSGNSTAYASTATLTIDETAGSPYLVAPPSAATAAIIDPTLPPPPMLLSIDFVPQNYSPTSYKSGAAAVGQTAADFWNALSCPGQYSATLPNLKTAWFGATAVGLVVNNTPGTWALGSLDPMYDGYMYPSYGQNGTLTLNGLTPGKYDVLLYGYDGNYSVTVGGTSYGNHQNRDWPLSNVLEWTEGKQYSRFPNVSVNSGQSLVVTLRPGADGYAVISGMQVLYVPDPPLVVTAPANQTVMEGSRATFSVGASGFAPLSFQWTRNGADISGATSSSLTTDGVDMSANGAVYAVRVANPGGSVTSAGATLTVLQCDPAAHPLSVDSWKTTCDDKFFVNVGNLTGDKLSGGQFDLFAYFDGVNRTYVRTLQPWGPGDMLPNGQNHLFTFCSVDRSIMGVDCSVVFRGGGTCGASPKFQIATRDNMALVLSNRTLVPTPAAECAHTTSPADVPYARPICDASLNCACDGWYPILPAIANGGSPQLDNFYRASDPPQYVNVSCPNQGFKNVYAMKQWHGTFGPRAGSWSGYQGANGDGTCSVPATHPTPDTTKYRTLKAHAESSGDYVYRGVHYPGSGSVDSICTVDRDSGNMSGHAEESGESGGAWQAIGLTANANIRNILNTYSGNLPINIEIPTPTGNQIHQPTYSSYGSTISCTWNFPWDFSLTGNGCTSHYYGHDKGTITCNLIDGIVDYHTERLVGFNIDCDPDEESEDTDKYDWTLTLSDSGATYVYDYSYTQIDHQYDRSAHAEAQVEYLDPYTSDDVNADCDLLLAQWDLLDDVQYPWRNDGLVTQGPLVTRNESAPAAPSILSPGKPLPPPQSPWPSQSAGAILGAPLPVHGPGGVLYSNQPYFNFYHVNYLFQESEVGHPEALIASYGAYSPFANATQWTDADQARIFPAGPFWAYGCGDHFGFWLKNPYLTDSKGVWEQGGYWGLVKCKWAETLSSHTPPGTDLVFKNWTFNFRDFIESYNWCKTAWWQNNFNTGCTPLGGCSPTRFTPVEIPVGQPLAGYYIGPGSWWISDMHCAPLHYNFDCCRPAVYVQPNSPGPDCGNGVFVAMPPAVCDEAYGSLWMGRVDQSTTDSHACDSYVANRNNGVPNPASCDPQVELDLVWHDSGGYELFYAPLGLSYGGDPPPPITVRLDIARKNWQVVPDEQKHSNGSVVQIVPEVNPGKLYPGGIFLEMPTLSIDPPSALARVHLKLKKINVSPNPAKIRVYRRTPEQAQYAVFLDEFTGERLVGPADLGCYWRLDSTAGGVVDLALIAESLNGTELARDTVRISSTPADPAAGRIVFVNPSSSSPAPPYDNFTVNAAHTIEDAVAIMQPEDNILIAPGYTYAETGIPLPGSGVLAGIGGRWNLPDPPEPTYSLADLFDFSSLPVFNNSSTTWASVFNAQGPAVPLSGSLILAGLTFYDCSASATANGKSGAAIHLENFSSSLPVEIDYCSFATNLAVDFGGAIYVSNMPAVTILSCRFQGNKVVRVATAEDQYDRGMGGAVATIESSLEIQDCSFINNAAQVIGGIDPGTLEYLVPPLGCAGGGGDVYSTNGALVMNRCRSSGAVAGVPRDDLMYGAPADARRFTGDGGSILVHGRDTVGATVQIASCKFLGSVAYGNGGGISLSYDSSPQGRSYLDSPLTQWKPTSLSGNCSGQIANGTFLNNAAGWQGGGVSVNGRLMQVNLQNCELQGGSAGGVHGAVEDGKGGAVSICGGIQWNLDPEGIVVVNNCNILECNSAANGGGIYCTIRGNLSVTGGTIIQGCMAEKGGTISPQTSGQGGGIHCSAGGFVTLSGAQLLNNVAAGNGGGLSVRSARATLDENVSILSNHALGTTAEATWGNGGGIFVTSGRHDPIADGLVASAYQNDGQFSSTSPGVIIAQNQAARLGGGLYTGWPLPGEFVGTIVILENSTVSLNLTAFAVNDSGAMLLPAQIATEQASYDQCSGGGEGQVCVWNADLRFNGTTITGGYPASPDIGIYQLFSTPPIGGVPPTIYTPGSLAKDALSQSPR